MERKRKESNIIVFVSRVVPYDFFSLPAVITGTGRRKGYSNIITTAHGDFGGSHKLYCIDKGGFAIWGIADDGDVYKKHKPSEAEVPLSKKEQEYIFWGILSLQTTLGIKKANDI